MKRLSRSMVRLIYTLLFVMPKPRPVSRSEIADRRLPIQHWYGRMAAWKGTTSPCLAVCSAGLSAERPASLA
jgi:hypothetical protein